eukprot:CAMPEP_0198288888 /NCGR_PEP_ID=MMETSP1449-20131203/7257_1 /TAXON_ID=420275 /ORGANISM="Attheya septentrionalis, Strain CCMP2084" /LENGTH=447 /DNA_ID=CAMNT_0043987121 /DNA_START=105 /DNA_END=1445 /DNA_ORIENTATION=+
MASSPLLPVTTPQGKQSPLKYSYGGADGNGNVTPPQSNSPGSPTPGGNRGLQNLQGLTMKVQQQNKLVRFFQDMGKKAVPFELGDFAQVRRVHFNPEHHMSVLFQMHGSVWPSVFPFCCANVLIALGVMYLRTSLDIDLTFPSTGHTFMSIMVSFLVVTRNSITYARFMAAGEHLSTSYRTCRELMQHVCVLTMHDTSPGAQKWRQNVAYRTILLLRVTMAAIEFNSTNVDPWDVVPDGSLRNEDGGEEDEDQDVMYFSLVNQENRVTKWAHGQRTLSDENFRAPIVLAYNLRAEIMKQRNGKLLANDMHCNEELKLLGFVGDFITAFHELQTMITTPFPFPLVQMTRTFLFFWVFTLPFCLVKEISEPIQVLLIIFFITYGFVGLEYVSMELEDPFGDDPSDFDDLGMAMVVFEDIYITIFKTDGSQSATSLRQKVKARIDRPELW